MNDLKPGDRVRVIGGCIAPIGMEGVIKQNDHSSIPYKVFFQELHNTRWLPASDVELIERKPERQLKIGDKVRIKSREWYKSKRNSFGAITSLKVFFNSEMAQHCGKICTIEDIIETDGWERYRLNGMQWAWTDDMFDPVEESSGRSWCDRVRDALGIHSGDKPASTEKLTLINSKQLLTNIKLD